MLLLINKPSGITSHDAISAVKKHLRAPARDALSDAERSAGIKPPKIKIWHAGTLDPMASGLMIAATDKDTKLLHSLTGSDKTYETTIDFSRRSDTRDLDYRKEYAILPLRKGDEGGSIPTQATITSHLDSIIWTHDLPLTPFSAKKVDGKKLYEYAREWKPIFLTVPMTIYGYKILDYVFPLLKVQLHVGSGTYIRSIGHRLWIQIGWDAILISLKRMSIGEYSLDSVKNPLIAQWDDKEIEYVVL
jgi:tRNA pseudouridine55 synthase